MNEVTRTSLAAARVFATGDFGNWRKGLETESQSE